MLDVMLDLETMGTSTDSAIVAIGAVEFDMSTCKTGSSFYQNIHLADSAKHGRKIDPATVLWWMSQPDEARRALMYSAEPLLHVLDKFDAWMECCAPRDQVRVWGNGPSFDNAILAATYASAGRKPPWKYVNDRCFRTICAMFPSITKDERQGTHHNALDDAKWQAEHVLKIRRVKRV
jgi:hypothetical protein